MNSPLSRKCLVKSPICKNVSILRNKILFIPIQFLIVFIFQTHLWFILPLEMIFMPGDVVVN